MFHIVEPLTQRSAPLRHRTFTKEGFQAMAKTIQELRRERGFRSAREFADALGISPSSMSRYDKDPETIPVKVAWAMADELGCSIDEVVGREHVTSGASELQDFYDGLLPETRSLFDELVEFAGMKDKAARQHAKDERDAKDDRLCRYYERAFYNSLYESQGFGDLVAFGSPMEERAAFEGFLRDQAARKRKPGIDEHCEGLEEELCEGYVDDGGERQFTEEQIQAWLQEEREHLDEEFGKRDEEVISEIMKAYDRLYADELRNWAAHTGETGPGTAIEYSLVRMPR